MGVGNFVGTVQTINPDVIGLSNLELEEFRPKPGLEDNICYINHAFNPMFNNIHKSWQNVELFFRIDDTGFLPLMMQRLGYDVHFDGELTNEYTAIIPQSTNMNTDISQISAFIPISTGCSQFCAFCIVPYARGVEKYLDVEQIVAEAKHHIDHGIQEITLLGQIVNKHPRFVEICQRILDLAGGLRWLRYTSPYPTFYDKWLLDLHASDPRMCPHIHMPLQSGSDRMLKKMFRGYTSGQFREFVDQIRAIETSHGRKISITSDVIVWFCDETDEDFQQTLDLVEYAKFDMIYIGKYSTRPGTYAARRYEDDVPQEIKDERRDRLNALLRKISSDNNHVEIGKRKTVLVTKIVRQSGSQTVWQYSGYTEDMKHIVFSLPKNVSREKELQVGQFVDVHMTDGESFMLRGEVMM